MFKKQLVLLVFMCSFIVSAQKKYHKTHYSNGQLKEEGWLTNNQKSGYWKFYYQKGTIAKEGHFKKNKPTKYWYFYQKNKSIEKEGHFKNGKKDSWWLFFSKQGEMNHKCQLKDGKKNGFCFRYHQRKLIKAEKYRKGKKIKEWTNLKSFKRENSLSDLY